MAENETDEEYQKNAIEFREWLTLQRSYPQNIDDKLLKRFLHCTYNDLEKAKKVMELFFETRTSLLEALTDRDPLSEEIQTAMSICKLAFIKAPGKRNIWILHLDDPGLKKYEYLPTLKLSLLQTDAWLLDDDVLEDEDIVIVDVGGISVKIFTKVNMSMEKIFHKFQQEAVPVRLKQVHIVNVHYFFSMIYSLMKSFLSKDVKDKIHFHTAGSTTLLDYLNKDDLPKEYGGTNRTMEEHTKDIIDNIIKHREHFLKDHLWTIVQDQDNPPTEDDNSTKPAKLNEAVRTLVIE